MSVWPSNLAGSLALETSEGALISVSVSVEPRLLEDLLEALAQLQFPINPQIYHDAALRYVYADGREEILPTTLVDFPAYAGRLPEIRRMLEAEVGSGNVDDDGQFAVADPADMPSGAGWFALCPYLAAVDRDIHFLH